MLNQIIKTRYVISSMNKFAPAIWLSCIWQFFLFFFFFLVLLILPRISNLILPGWHISLFINLFTDISAGVESFIVPPGHSGMNFSCRVE